MTGFGVKHRHEEGALKRVWRGVFHLSSVLLAVPASAVSKLPSAARLVTPLLALSFAVSGCVSSSTSSTSANINTLFSQTDAPASEKVLALENQIVPAQESAATPSPPEPVGSASAKSKSASQQKEIAPAVKNALVASTESTEAPAQAAARQITTPKAEIAQAPAQKLQAKPTAAAVPVPPADVSKTESEATQVAALPPAQKKKKPKGFWASIFEGSPTNKSTTSAARKTNKRVASVKQRDQDSRLERRVKKRSKRGTTTGLPGVSLKKLFGIDTEDVDEFDEPVRLASVTNLARRGTHGLLLQHSGVKVGCFEPELVRILKKVERRFGRTPIVTSGYRSPQHNRRIRGARNSMHVHCKAADIQVKGVSKWTLAKYLRSLPERGGVGTYCHTKSVHIDTAGKRDWNRRCKRRRKA